MGAFFPRAARNPAASVRLVCLPFAGGSAASYAALEPALSDCAEVLPAELPGRGARMGEPFAEALPALAAALAAEIAALPAKPLVLFGHSMGALVAHATARVLAQGGRPPAGLVLSGRRAPHLPAPHPPRHALDDAGLKAELRHAGGTPEGVFARPELLGLFLPVVRADYRLAETYAPTRAALMPPLALSADVIGGSEDHANPRDALVAWTDLFLRPPHLALWPGDHFFIRTQQPRLIAHLRGRVADWTGPR